MTDFTITADHLTLLRAAYWRWDDCEFGAPAIDPKHPYGNSDVIGDIAELLGQDLHDVPDLADEQADELTQLHRETFTVLAIGLDIGEFREGTYRRTPDGWQRVEGVPVTDPTPRPDVPEPPDGRPTADRDAVERARTDGGTRALIARAMWRRDTVPSTAAQTGGYVWEFADRIATHALPEIGRQVREQVAAEIYAERSGGTEHWDIAMDHAARIARGESR